MVWKGLFFKTVEKRFEFLNFLLAFLFRRKGLRNAMLQVDGEDVAFDGADCGADSFELYQDIRAITAFFNHFFDAFQLSRNTVKTREVGGMAGVGAVLFRGAVGAGCFHFS